MQRSLEHVCRSFQKSKDGTPTMLCVHKPERNNLTRILVYTV